MTLNLKHPESKQVLFDLIAEADIVVENYSAGVTKRLGVDYASVRHLNEKLVYTSISGFGAGTENGDRQGDGHHRPGAQRRDDDRRGAGAAAGALWPADR